MTAADLVTKYTQREAATLVRLARCGKLALDTDAACALIGRLPADQVLNRRELEYWSNLPDRQHDPVEARAVRHQSLVFVMKVTRLCNLRCQYCRSWAEGPGQTMTFPIMVEAVRQALSYRTTQIVDFVLHGGEATMLRPRVLEKLIWLQQQFKRPDQRIRNSIQTNAVELPDDWIELVKFLRMPVGLSLDGPPELNDAVRIDKEGKGTSGRVASTVARLKSEGLLHGALVVVSRDTLRIGARRLFDYFLSIGLMNFDFLNVLPENGALSEIGLDCAHYLSIDEYIAFLSAAFDLWWHEYSDRLRITIFLDLLAAVSRTAKPKACLWSGNCLNRIFTVEANGDVSACDKFIGANDYVYGNLQRASLDELVSRSRFVATQEGAQRLAVGSMVECPWMFVCAGGCPHDHHLDKHVRGIAGRKCCGLSPLLERLAAAADAESDRAMNLLEKARSTSQAGVPLRPQ